MPYVPDACPRCGSPHVAWILYGEPVPGYTERLAPTPVTLGGCVVWADAPRWECLACHHMWGRYADERSAR